MRTSFCADQDIMNNGHTAYFNRIGVDYDGPVYPFGCEITYKANTDKDKATDDKEKDL